MQLILPQDDRAARLLEGFDLRYDQFARELPDPLRAQAGVGGTFKGRQNDEPFIPSTGTNIIYTCTPWIFWELFCDMEDQHFLEIAFAGGLISLASVLMDHIIDQQVDQPHLIAVLHLALFQRGVSALQALFPTNSRFWSHFQRLNSEHLHSLAIELDLQTNPKALSEEDFQAMAGGKVSPVVITIAAFAAAVDRIDILEPIESSLKHTFIAGQMHDDVLDWQYDLEASHCTYFLSRYLLTEDEQTQKWPTAEDILEKMETNWEDTGQLDMAVEGYKCAIEAVAGLDCDRWVSALEGTIQTAEEHKRELYRVHVVRAIKQAVVSPGKDLFPDG
ncbi:MAG: hypothetical protein MUO76_00515 [Anaerolineaceae bacterium]|nr:hypothetical protein [Anaerolineaceae bacterium]